MSSSWKQLFGRTSTDLRLMTSLCCPATEPDCMFYDIRRSFPKDGSAQPTRQGLRFKVTLGDLTLLANRMELLLMGIQTYTELEGRLNIVRGEGSLTIQKLPKVEGNPRLSLSPSEAKFCFECIREVIANWSAIVAVEEEEELQISTQMIENVRPWL